MTALAKSNKPGKPGKARQDQDEDRVQGDIGPDTAAQRHGAQIVEFNLGGSRIRRKRRNHLLDRMQRRGTLNSRQVVAGIELLDRWEATWLSPPPAWTRDHVDSSPRPGDVNVAGLEAKRRYIELSQWIEREWRWLVQAVILHEKPIRPALTKSDDAAMAYRAALRRQLNRLATALRI